MQNHITLRQLEARDLLPLRQISIDTFVENYAHLNEPEAFEQHLERNFSEAQLLSELRDTAVHFFFAETEGQVLGYLKLAYPSPMAHDPSINCLELVRIYVRPAYQKWGIGKLFLEKTKAMAHKLGAEAIWLGVWQKNLQAQEWYQRQGFRKVATHTFMLGNEAQDDDVYFMGLRG
jgi:diamine N-acetyltransferase